MTKHLLKLVWSRKRSNALLIIEVFFSFLVLYAVAVTAIYYADNHRHPLGFSFENVWDVSVSTRSGWTDEDAETMRQLMLAVEELPEIRAVAGVSIVPYSAAEIDVALTYNGRTVRAGGNLVTDDYAGVMGLTLTRGRWFEPSDEAMHWESVVLNERLARRLFGDEDPVGKRVDFEFVQYKVECKVVGVVQEYREQGEYAGLRDYVFRRAAVDSGELRNMVIATRAGASAAFEEKLSARLQAAAPDWSFDVQPLTEKRALNNRYRLLALQSAGIVAAFLMLMVAFGLSGIMWQNVTRRTEEFGLRRAFGGTAHRIRVQVILELILIVSVGALAGALLALQVPLLGLIGFIESRVYMAAFALSLILIYAITLAAGLYPGWLATRIHPSEALHYE